MSCDIKDNKRQTFWKKMRRQYATPVTIGVLIVNIIFIMFVGFGFKSVSDRTVQAETVDFNEGWTLVREGKDDEQIELPYYDKSEAGEKLVLINTLDDSMAGQTLSYAADNQIIIVQVDGEVVYKYGTEQRGGFLGAPKDETADASGMEDNTTDALTENFEGDSSDEDFGWKNHAKLDAAFSELEASSFSTGASQHFINIPTSFEDGTIEIIITSREENAAAHISSMTVGPESDAIVSLMVSNAPGIVSVVIILMSAIILILLSIIQLCSKQNPSGMLCLSFFFVDAGIYYLMETRIVSLFAESDVLSGVISSSCLIMMPILLALYFEKRFGATTRNRWNVLILIGVMNLVASIVMLRFDQNEVFTHVSHFGGFDILLLVCVVVMFTYFGLAITSLWVTNKNIERIAMAILIFGVVCELISSTTSTVQWVSSMGRNCFVAYAVIMLLAHIFDMTARYAESFRRNARLLKRQVKIAEKNNAELKAANEVAEEARRQAEAAAEAKGRFLANMSHEIRTPINAVLGMNSMILRETTEADIKGYSMDIDSAGQSLLSLVNDILDYSKLESGKLEIIPVEYDLSSLVNDVVNMIAKKAQDKELKFEIDIEESLPSRLMGDDVRIRQVLINILTNAVKYTHEGGFTLTIKDAGGSDDETLRMYASVKDTGIGIKEEDIGKLFEEFERIEESRNRNIEGTGLGMNITTSLLDMMGSKLEVQSVYGEGSDFFFTIDQKIVDATPIGDLKERIRRMSEEYNYSVTFVAPEARLLVVDDNEMNLKVFTSLLKETCVNIDEAESGAQALDLCRDNKYDIIFLDHMMPGMDGVETLKRLKEMEDTTNLETPTVALTANAVSGAREEYLEHGFNDFLSKPVEPDKLEAMIVKYLDPALVITDKAEIEEIKKLLGAGQKNDKQGKEMPQSGSGKKHPGIEGIDWERGIKNLASEELLVGMMGDFKRAIHTEADSLENFYNGMIDGGEDAISQEKGQSYLDLYRIKVHGMKSSSAMIGACGLSKKALELEMAAKERDFKTIYSKTDEFLWLWRDFDNRLSAVIVEKDDKKEIENVDELRSLVDQIKTAMEDFDVDVADENIETLKGFAYNSDEQTGALEALAAAVANLETDDIPDLCDRFIQSLE